MASKFDEERLDRVERMMLAAIPCGVIRQRLSKEYGCPGRTVKRMIAEVHRRWEAQASETSADDWRNRLTLMALDRFRVAVDKGHESTADRLIDTIARLQGLGAAAVSSIVNVYDRGSAGFGQAITDKVRELRAQQLASGSDDDGDKGNGGSN